MTNLVEIIIDTHEAESNILDEIIARDLGATSMRHLTSGDVVIRHNLKTVSLEIKRESDFSNSLQSGRLHLQLIKMYEHYDFSMLVVENWHPYVTNEDNEDSIREKVRLHELKIMTLNRRITVYETKDSSETVDLIEDIIRDMIANKLFVLRRPVTVETNVPDNVALLCQLPFIDKVLATRILDEFGSVENALFHHLEDLEEIEGIGQKKLSRIKKVLSMEG